MHFDDTLDTVLSADFSSAFERQSAFRQLTDLIGRRRVPADARAIDALSRLVPDVPVAIRAAAARGLATANPPAALVAVFARDVLAVAAPVLRGASLSTDEWRALLPELSPSSRAVLRHRRDLGDDVARALASFGAVDFVLGDARLPLSVAVEAAAMMPATASSPPAAPVPQAPPAASIGAVAATMPSVADTAGTADASPSEPDGPFEIADVVARIDAFCEQRDRGGETRPGLDGATQDDRFRFETDAAGVVRWADGMGRAPLLGLSLAMTRLAGTARVDAAVSGAFRQRSGFRDARLTIDSASPASGGWLLSGIPAFDPHTGRFIGYRGTARRPRTDEVAGPVAANRNARADAYRQLVHELRTPTTAIVGFSEMIELEVLGPVDDPYRDRATAMRRHARDLLGAIDDLDLAARIDSDSLTLHPESVSLRAVIAVVADDLRPLCELRAADIGIPDRDVAVRGDRHAIERLIGRLTATLLSATRAGECIAMTLAQDGDGVVLSITRPAALAVDARSSHDDLDDENNLEAVPLGTGFALRLVGNLARELGGSLLHDERELVLRLPAAEAGERQRAGNY